MDENFGFRPPNKQFHGILTLIPEPSAPQQERREINLLKVKKWKTRT